jgi:prepilin-type N-terminal cleavage/methylation domain-containing protein
MRDRDAGFTLIEMMVTLAVIAILAVIALPSFFGEARRTRALAEVQPMFNDLRVRLEQYLQENGRYPALSPGESTLHPGAAPNGSTAVALNPLPLEWMNLRVRISGTDRVYCRYTWMTGDALNTTVGAQATVFGFAPPALDWYYLLAKCDMDNSGAGSGTGGGDGFSWYFASSTDPTLQKRNDGD